MKHSINAEQKGVKAAVTTAFLLLWAFQGIGFGQTAGSQDWKTLKGKHFLIHIQPNASQDALFFGQKVLTEAERYYDRIQTTLGHLNQDPWLWDHRCHINLYRDKQSYVKEAGRPSWSSASASFDGVPTIDSHLGAKGFLETELPHEIAHLLFREYVGVDNANVPRWMDEGIALFNEKSDRGSMLDKMVRAKAHEGRLISLAALSGNFNNVELSGAKWGSEESITLYYAQSYSIIQFLVDRFGQPRFVEFVRSLKNGGTVEQSLRKTYGTRFQNLASFENEWLKALNFSKTS